MLNPFAEINWRPSVNDLRRFGTTLAVGGLVMLVVGCLVFGLTDCQRFGRGFGIVGAVIMVAGLLVFALPRLGKPLYYVWFVLGASIGIVVSNGLLMLFYYCFFSVIGLVMRLCGRDVLVLKRPPRDRSMWVEHRQPPSLVRYYRQF